MLNFLTNIPILPFCHYNLLMEELLHARNV